MDLKKDLKEILNGILERQKLKPIRNDLVGLLSSFYNLQDKTIIIQKRRVYISKELQDKIIKKPYDNYLRQVCVKFRNGEDVNPYLSKLSVMPQKNDLLLYDWGIHHLHLNDKYDYKGFIKRSDYLLFFMLKENSVYFIDVSKHRLKDRTEFSQQNLLKIVKRNWSHLMEPHKLKGFTALSQPIDDQTYSSIRNAGGQTLVEIEGEVFTGIGGMISTAKTNVKHTQKSHHVIGVLMDLEDEIRAKQEIVNSISLEYNINTMKSDFKLMLGKERFFVIETNTGVEVFTVEGLYDDIYSHLLEI